MPIRLTEAQELEIRALMKFAALHVRERKWLLWRLPAFITSDVLETLKFATKNLTRRELRFTDLMTIVPYLEDDYFTTEQNVYDLIIDKLSLQPPIVVAIILDAAVWPWRRYYEEYSNPFLHAIADIIRKDLLYQVKPKTKDAVVRAWFDSMKNESFYLDLTRHNEELERRFYIR